MNPFSYPSGVHDRKGSPGPFEDYRRYKPFLRIEFSGQCVYCRMPDGVRGEATFGVDHYRPTSRFPELVCAYQNLFYACNRCNSRKSGFWPDDEHSARGVLVPNPCDHRMTEHLQFNGPRVEAASPAGHFTRELLALNDEDEVRYREFILRSIRRCLAEMERCLQALEQIDALIASPGSEEHLIGLRAQFAWDLLAHQADLERLAGSSPYSPLKVR